MMYKILIGDALEQLKTIESGTVNTCVTSPPYYGLRDYGVDGQIGLEETPEQYISKLVDVFREVRRVLRDDGTLWVNIGDSYAGSGKGPAGNLGAKNDERNMEHTTNSGLVPDGCKPKDLIGIPWMLAFALRADGWYLRQDIVWAKPNPMPESVKDRCTKSHEYIFLLSKYPKYYYDNKAIMEPSVCFGNDPRSKNKRTPYQQGKSLGDDFQGKISCVAYPSDGMRNKRDVWNVSLRPYKGAHFAVFPPDLIKPCVLAGCPADGLVLDPFTGSGTTGVVSLKNGRNFIGIELNPAYAQLAEERIKGGK